MNSSESVSAMNVSGLTFSPGVTRSSLPIPDDLVFVIFLRLPSKGIARCRCLSKLWASMLRSQYFTESFLSKSFARPQLLFAFDDDKEILFFSSPQPENPEENSYVVAANHLARFPGRESTCITGFLSYGDTLIMNYGFEKVICNPSTGQSLTLPRLNPRLRAGVDSYLGYDPVSKEFKLLSMNVMSVAGDLFSVDHQVLTLGTKNSSWRLVECCIPHYTSCKWICINAVIYYAAAADSSFFSSMLVCFDLRTEEFSFVNFLEIFNREMHESTTLVNYNGRVGLILASGFDFGVSQASKSFDVWVLQDAEWSKHVYVLPPSWKDVVAERMCIIGMVGTNEIVLSPSVQYMPSYIIYFNVESKRIRKVGIKGLEAVQGIRSYTYLNYVENVKLL